MTRIITLGEIMLRLSTSSGVRLEQSGRFAAHYGGGEANVAISLANYGHDVSFASKVPANDLGKAVTHHFTQLRSGLQSASKRWSPAGTYYMESGVGERAAKVIYDRAGSSFAEIKTNEWSGSDL